jgi:hypothetical protein
MNKIKKKKKKEKRNTLHVVYTHPVLVKHSHTTVFRSKQLQIVQLARGLEFPFLVHVFICTCISSED